MAGPAFVTYHFHRLCSALLAVEQITAGHPFGDIHRADLALFAEYLRAVKIDTTTDERIAGLTVDSVNLQEGASRFYCQKLNKTQLYTRRTRQWAVL